MPRPTGLPLIGNGDVFSYEDYERHMSSGRLATCMIGRVPIKPWVLTEIKEKRCGTSRRCLGIFQTLPITGSNTGVRMKKGETTRRFMLSG